MCVMLLRHSDRHMHTKSNPDMQPSAADGLRSAHLDPVPFERDGCYFLHKDAHYDTEGRTPLALLWKDPSSRFFIDTDVHGVVSAHQHVVLRYAEDRQVCTDDEPPIALGRMPEDFAQRTAATLRCVSIALSHASQHPSVAIRTRLCLVSHAEGRAASCAGLAGCCGSPSGRVGSSLVTASPAGLTFALRGWQINAGAVPTPAARYPPRLPHAAIAVETKCDPHMPR